MEAVFAPPEHLRFLYLAGQTQDLPEYDGLMAQHREAIKASWQPPRADALSRLDVLEERLDARRRKQAPGQGSLDLAGKPCGESFISADYDCRKGVTLQEPGRPGVVASPAMPTTQPLPPGVYERSTAPLAPLPYDTDARGRPLPERGVYRGIERFEKKVPLTVPLPNGQTATRTTERVYRYVGWHEGSNYPLGGWHGNLAVAQKAIGQKTPGNYSYNATHLIEVGTGKVIPMRNRPPAATAATPGRTKVEIRAEAQRKRKEKLVAGIERTAKAIEKDADWWERTGAQHLFHVPAELRRLAAAVRAFDLENGTLAFRDQRVPYMERVQTAGELARALARELKIEFTG